MDKEALANRVIEWSNINSGSFNIPGLQRMAAVLTQAFKELDAEGNIFSLPPMEQVDVSGATQRIDLGPMLRFWKRPYAPIQVLLVGHMDTVFGVDHPFQRATRINSAIINGPGVADMKGGLCVMLEALKLFEQDAQAHQLGWEVLINSDEEIGSLGSSTFLAERAKSHQIGLVFEPAMDEKGTLAGARKGSGKFTVVVHGRAAHAGRHFQDGRNAITCMAKIISAIDALNGQRKDVTINVGEVQGGEAVNVVPPLAICRLDVRILQLEDTAWVQEQLTNIMAGINQIEGYKVELHGGFTRKPKSITGKTEKLYQLVQEVGAELGQALGWQPSGGCSDGNNLSEAGLPNVDTLGVCGGAIHSNKEYLLVDSLVARAQLTAFILKRLAQRGF